MALQLIEHRLSFVLLQAVGDPGQGWGNALVFVCFSAKVRQKLFVRPMRILFNRLLLLRSQGNPVFSSGVLRYNTPDANVVQGSINTSDLVNKQYCVSPSVESVSDFEVISSQGSDTYTEAPVTPAEICNQLL